MSGNRVVLITGAAKRIGRELARYLHARAFNIIIHYRRSAEEARSLADELNAERKNSAALLQADFSASVDYQNFIDAAISAWGRLDVIIHNASSFFPTKIASVSEKEWNELFSSNVKASFFLAQAGSKELAERQGTLINIIDVYGFKPLRGYCVYSAAKASLVMLTKALALELAPAIRVNGIAPGSVLWPEGDSALDRSVQEKILRKIPLQRSGTPEDIAQGVEFLIQATYVTGHVLCIDGGKSI